MENQVRIDKWLWAVRLYKTRSLATEACQKGRVSIDGVSAKPSRSIKIGDLIKIKKPPVTYTYKVIQLAEKRMAAKLVPGFMADLTPPEELEILQMQQHMSIFQRDRGTGRPTKKERRDIDDFFND